MGRSPLLLTAALRNIIRKHGETEVLVGSVLFSGDRKIIFASANGQRLLETVIARSAG